MSSEVDNGVKLFASLLRAIRNVYEFRKGAIRFCSAAIVGTPVLVRGLLNVLRLFGRKVAAYLNWSPLKSAVHLSLKIY